MANSEIETTQITNAEAVPPVANDVAHSGGKMRM